MKEIYKTLTNNIQKVMTNDLFSTFSILDTNISAVNSKNVKGIIVETSKNSENFFNVEMISVKDFVTFCRNLAKNDTEQFLYEGMQNYKGYIATSFIKADVKNIKVVC